VQEPLFEFLLGMVEQDSLGTWTGADLAAYVRRAGRPSRFPLEEVVRISRRRPPTPRSAHYPGAEVRAVWSLELTGNLDRPMPYSILGYHPGSLRVAGRLVLAELAPQILTLHAGGGEGPGTFRVTGFRVFALEEGYVLLDADGWLDALLGGGLDDAWIVGFVTAREDGRRVGLGVSLGRDGRRIYGEFDFARDAILAHGRPRASAMSRAGRTWLDPDRAHLPVPWSAE